MLNKQNFSQQSLSRSTSSNKIIECVSITTNELGQFQVYYPTPESNSSLTNNETNRKSTNTCPTVTKFVPHQIISELTF